VDAGVAGPPLRVADGLVAARVGVPPAGVTPLALRADEAEAEAEAEEAPVTVATGCEAPSVDGPESAEAPGTEAPGTEAPGTGELGAGAEGLLLHEVRASTSPRPMPAPTDRLRG
jgi:hypothetical protein